jgi:hypothetical protein
MAQLSVCVFSYIASACEGVDQLRKGETLHKLELGKLGKAAAALQPLCSSFPPRDILSLPLAPACDSFVATTCRLVYPATRPLVCWPDVSVWAAVCLSVLYLNRASGSRRSSAGFRFAAWAEATLSERLSTGNRPSMIVL